MEIHTPGLGLEIYICQKQLDEFQGTVSVLSLSAATQPKGSSQSKSLPRQVVSILSFLQFIQQFTQISRSKNCNMMQCIKFCCCCSCRQVKMMLQQHWLATTCSEKKQRPVSLCFLQWLMDHSWEYLDINFIHFAPKLIPNLKDRPVLIPSLKMDQMLMYLILLADTISNLVII